MGPPMLRAAGVSFAYPPRGRAAEGPPRVALDDVSLQVCAGEVVGLLGPNGSGKSTLLRVAARLLEPGAGRLEIDGRPAGRARRAERRMLGYAGHDVVHFDELTGRENAVFFARASGLATDDAERRVLELLERLGLRSAADRPVSIYSHGMRRKLLVAETLAHEPQLLLLDEPTSGLDPESKEALFRLLSERAAEGAAVLLSTHEPQDAAAWCDRVVLLHRGKVVLEGRPRELIAELGARVRITVRFTTTRAPHLELEGVDVEEVNRHHVVVTAAAPGGVALLEVCARLDAQGCRITDVHLREPGLRDVFARATGVTLGDPGGGP